MRDELSVASSMDPSTIFKTVVDDANTVLYNSSDMVLHRQLKKEGDLRAALGPPVRAKGPTGVWSG